jgi:hypothetical protein
VAGDFFSIFQGTGRTYRQNLCDLHANIAVSIDTAKLFNDNQAIEWASDKIDLAVVGYLTVQGRGVRKPADPSGGDWPGDSDRIVNGEGPVKSVSFCHFERSEKS